MIIRIAKLSDARGIAKVHVDCWRTTYKGIFSETFLNSLSYEKRKKTWTHNIFNEDNTVFVAENKDGKIIGFADGSSVKMEEYPEYDGDVISICILKEFQRLGVGKRLLKRLFAEFEKVNFNSAIVKVLEENNSCRFYEAMGAKLLDDKTIKLPDDNLKILVYGWEDIRNM